MTHRRSAVLLALLLAACPRKAPRAPAVAATDRSDGAIPTLRAAHVAVGSVQVDGRLDEPVWRATGTTGGLVHPGTGRPEPASRVQGAAWLAWDDENLYLAARVYDAAPTSPFSERDRDPHVWERASAVELMLQPGDPGDNLGYYEVQVDVSGARWTTSFDDYNRPITRDPDTGATLYGHQDWEPSIRAAARVERAEGRYTLELALPWRDVRASRATSPPRPGDTWRVNVYSFRDGQRDALAWSPLLGQGNFHRVARFGRVTFAP